MLPRLQSTCHYMVNHVVKILHVLLGGGGGRVQIKCTHYARGLGAQTEKIPELDAHWALAVYPVFEDENSNGSDERWSSE